MAFSSGGQERRLRTNQREPEGEQLNSRTRRGESGWPGIERTKLAELKRLHREFLRMLHIGENEQDEDATSEEILLRQ